VHYARIYVHLMPICTPFKCFEAALLLEQLLEMLDEKHFFNMAGSQACYLQNACLLFNYIVF